MPTVERGVVVEPACMLQALANHAAVPKGPSASLRLPPCHLSAQGVRKIVLATNIAETAITIDDVV